VAGPIHTAVAIDDANVCTTDACDPVAGVSHTAIPVTDNNACTTDACDPVAGVSHTAVVITDNNACTTDACDTTTGAITHVALANITDNNACTTDTCNPATGTTTHAAVANCCAHSQCLADVKLDAPSCTYAGAGNDCATKVCAADAFCCNNSWDTICVGEAKNPSICPTALAPTNFTCNAPHSYCVTGVALVKTQDPCVKKICEVDSFCCTNSWDATCVSETNSQCHIPTGANCK
jgi:hypothetical protein